MPPLEHAVLIVPLKAAGAAAGKKKKAKTKKKKLLFCRFRKLFRCFPCVKGNPIKFYGAFWLLPAFVFRL